MSPFALIWLQFAACLAWLFGLAGPELSRGGDVIAEKTGLSGSWIGLVLLGLSVMYLLNSYVLYIHGK